MSINRNHHTTMNRTKVTSSQIAEIGHDPATNTLEIQFHPNRKQKETNQPGSIYRYSNVTADDHKALVTAESIGSTFGKHIKPNIEKYPFQKVN